MIRTSLRAISILGALALFAFAAACAPAPTPEPTAVPPTPTALELPTAAAPATEAPTSAPTEAAANATGDEIMGASLYQISCAACHGKDHAGNTFDMDGQKIEVPSLTWDDLSKMYATDPSRGNVHDQLVLTITQGKDESGDDLNEMMPRWSSLSQGQVDSLIQYIQTGDTSANLSTAAQNLQGEQLYAAACAACHGADAAGKTFEDDSNKIETPSLHWSELSKMYSENPSRGTVAEQAALAITKGQDESGEDLNAMMPRWSNLSKAQVDSLVQYLQTAFP